MSPTTIAIAALGLLLAVSIAGNAFLFNSRDQALEAKASAETAGAAWQASATTCTASVDKLASDNKLRSGEILAAINGQAARIKGLQHDALAAIGAKPDNPQDLCGSLERYFRAQIKAERGAK